MITHGGLQDGHDVYGNSPGMSMTSCSKAYVYVKADKEQDMFIIS